MLSSDLLITKYTLAHKYVLTNKLHSKLYLLTHTGDYFNIF